MLERRPELQVVRLDETERAAFEERATVVREQHVDDVGPRGAELLSTFEAATSRAQSEDAPR